MPELDRQTLITYALVALAVVLIGVRYLHAGSGGSAPVAELASAVDGFGDGATGATAGAGELVVHVSGAVRRPGIVRLHEGDRVVDAVEAAGGVVRRADLSAVNLAARLADGQQVVVPARVKAGAGAVASAAGGAATSGPISLATATFEQLQTLDGIGPALAQKIIDYRTEHGGFSSVDQLSEVSGIGEKRLAALREQLQP